MLTYLYNEHILCKSIIIKAELFLTEYICAFCLWFVSLLQPPGLGDDNLMGITDDPQTYQQGGGPGSVTGSNNPRYDQAADTMQGLEIGSQQGSNYGGQMDPNLPDLGPHMDLSFQPDPTQQPPPQQQHPHQGPPPQHPNQQDQMAAWFDTDL